MSNIQNYKALHGENPKTQRKPGISNVESLSGGHYHSKDSHDEYPVSSVERGSSAGNNGLHNQTAKDGFIRIKRIRMVGFRSFEDYTLDFPPGLVFVCGPNESGKTGIMKAIQLGLFTDAGTSRKDVRRLTRWGSDQGFRIELVLENQDGQWEIIKDFDTGRNMLSKPDGARVRDKHRILEVIAGLLGIPKEGAEAAYISSVCVLQDELATGGEDLKKLIENRVVGGGVDVIKLADDADKKIRELRAGRMGGVYQGELTRASNRVSEFEKKLDDLKAKVNQGQEARTRVLELTQLEEELSKQVIVLDETLKKAKIHAQAQDIVERESRELKSISDQKQDLEAFKKKLAEIEPEIQALSEAKKKLDEQVARKHRLDEIERDIVKAREERARLGELCKKAESMLQEAETLERKLKSLVLIVPEKVERAVELSRRLSHHNQDLLNARGVYAKLQEDISTHMEIIKAKSEEKSRLSTLLEIREQYELANSISAYIQGIEFAIGQYEGNRRKLAALVPVSESDVKEAESLSREISAMSKVPAGLNLEICTASGVKGQMGIDESPGTHIEPGSARFSARKRIRVNIPQVLDMQVNTTDAKPFFDKMGQAQAKLSQILQRYNVKSVEALLAVFAQYQSVESQVSHSYERLANLVAAIDVARFEALVEEPSGSEGAAIRLVAKGLPGDCAGDNFIDSPLSKQANCVESEYGLPRKAQESCKESFTVAQNILDTFRLQLGELKPMVSQSLADLDMTLEELKEQQVLQIEEKLQGVKRRLQDEAQSMAKLKGSVDSLELEKREAAVQSIADSIDALVREAGCVSLEDMVAKRDELLFLKGAVQDRKSRAGDLLGDKNIEELHKEIDGANEKITALEEEKSRIFAKGPLTGNLEEQLHKAEQGLKNKETKRERLIGRISAVNLEALNNKQIDIIGRLVPAQEQLQKTRPYKMLPTEVVEKERELDEKRNLLDRLNKDKAVAKATVQIVTEGAEDIAGATEELDDAKRYLAHIEREVKILEILKDVFPEARTRAVSGIFDLLSKASSKYIGQMTAGKYTRMEISEDFSPMLYSEARGKPINGTKEMHLLSAGTADQVLLSVRLAVADLMSQGKCPPFIMDDPFIHFDPARRQAGIKVLQQISNTYQVIVFTCHDYEEIPARQKLKLA